MTDKNSFDRRPNPISLCEPMNECPVGDTSIISNDSESDIEQLVDEMKVNQNGKSLIENESIVKIDSQKRFEFVKNNQFWSKLPLLTKSLMKNQEP